MSTEIRLEPNDCEIGPIVCSKYWRNESQFSLCGEKKDKYYNWMIRNSDKSLIPHKLVLHAKIFIALAKKRRSWNKNISIPLIHQISLNFQN